MKVAKYYRLDIVMKTGFKYSSVCIGRMLEGSKKSASGDWTESVTVVEITEEEYHAFWGGAIVDEPKVASKKKTPKDKKVAEVETKKPKKGKLPQFANIEDFLK